MPESFTVLDDTPERHDIPIRPSDFTRAGGGGYPSLPSTFGKSEVESAGGRLIAFFQLKNCWHGFRLSELANFHRQHGWNPDTMLFGIAGAWYDDGLGASGWRAYGEIFIAFDGDQCYVTDAFVTRCGKCLKAKAA